MAENNNNQIKSGLSSLQTGPETHPDNNSQAAGFPQNSGSQIDDYLFFNVMPKNNNQGQVVAQEIQVIEQTNQTSPENGKLKIFFKKYKPHISIGTGVIILGIAAFFVLPHIIKLPKTENLLIDNPNAGKTTVKNQPSESAVLPNSLTSKEWQLKYFNNEQCVNPEVCGDDADPDKDGLSNLQEFTLNTDPNNPDSDQDGLADGDEVQVFGTNPLLVRTANKEKYTDKDDAQGGYASVNPGRKYSEDELKAIAEKMQSFSLHEPTLTSLKASFGTVYSYIPPKEEKPPGPEPANSSEQSQELPKNLDISAEAKQDRDAQRTNSIRNIAVDLIKYKTDKGTFPKTTNFASMFETVKIYSKIAINPIDPINAKQFVYGYEPSSDYLDFVLSFYSETQNLLIKIKAQDGLKYQESDEAALYDNQRKTDLESLRLALLLYSNKNSSGSQEYVFPTELKYKTEIVPTYLSSIPKDPQTQKEYEYKPSDKFDSFVLKTVLSSPPAGTSGYLCNQEECRYY